MASRQQAPASGIDIRAAREFVKGAQAKQAETQKAVAESIAFGVLSAVLFQAATRKKGRR